jgi:glycosyltransferase involved in cell wall biosynthesis
VGGVPEHVLTLSRELIGRHRWDVEVAIPPESPYAGRMRAAGVTVHELALRRRPGAPDLLALRAIDRLVAGREPDLVHAHSSKAGALVRLSAADPRRTLYTPHCFAFAAGFGSMQCSSYAVVERGLSRRAAAMITVSDWERARAVERLGHVADRIVTIHNGVDPEAAVGAPVPGILEWAEGRPVVAYLGRLDEEKGPLRFVEAFARAARDPSFTACGLVVGDGALRDAVGAEIARHGLGARLRQEPYGGAVAPWLACMSLFVLPSRWESLPISVLEAMSAGVPVLATAVGGTAEAVVDGVTGRLVPAGDGEALAAAMCELATDPAALRRMGRAGRERVEAEFTTTRVALQTVGLYHEVLDRVAARRPVLTGVPAGATGGR